MACLQFPLTNNLYKADSFFTPTFDVPLCMSKRETVRASNWKVITQPAKLQKKQFGGVYFCVYGTAFSMPIQQKLPLQFLVLEGYWFDAIYDNITFFVFLHTGEEQPQPKESSVSQIETRQDFTLAHGSISGDSYTKNTGMALFRQRWWAMFMKKVIHSKRYRISLIAQLLMPCFFVMTSLITVRSFPRVTDEPSAALSLQMFDKTSTPYAMNESVR